MAAELTLRNERLAVTLRPDDGCDIVALVDARTGVDLLFTSPWGGLPLGAGQLAATSQERWLARYPGGWQVLCPNGGDECDGPGVRWGFHGEACLVPWTVEDAGAERARLTTRLTTAPLALERELRLDDAVLRVEESIVNEGSAALEVMWVHHPAFGEPLIGAGATLRCGARRVLADPVAPGAGLAPGSEHAWPLARTAAGEELDLSRLPAGPRALLAYLTDFDEPWFALSNPEVGLGVGMRWSADAFPHAWLWQELRATPEYPWFGRTAVCAVEPASTIPAHGLATARARGGSGVTLAPGERRTATIEAVVFHERAPVRSIEPGGRVRFAETS